MKTKTIPNTDLKPQMGAKSPLNNVKAVCLSSDVIRVNQKANLKPAPVAGFSISCLLAQVIEAKTGANDYRPSDETLEKLGVSLIRFNKIYKGSALPSITEAVSLTRFFDCALSDLFNIEETNVESGNKNDLEIHLLQKYG